MCFEILIFLFAHDVSLVSVPAYGVTYLYERGILLRIEEVCHRGIGEVETLDVGQRDRGGRDSNVRQRNSRGGYCDIRQRTRGVGGVCV